MVSGSTRSFRAYVKCEANQADTLLVEAGYADTLGPAAELLEVSVKVGEPHPQKQQDNSQPKTASGLIPGGSGSKESACNAGDPGLIPGSGRSPGKGHGNPL